MHSRVALGLLCALSAANCVKSGARIPFARERLPLDRVGILEPSAGNLYVEIERACSISSVAGRLQVRGTIAGRRMQTRLWIASMAAVATRLESDRGSKPPSFILSADHENATLLLPRVGRVLAHEPFWMLLEAALGLPLGAEDLHQVLTCPRAAGEITAWRLTAEWVKVQVADQRYGYQIFLRREDDGAWTLRAMVVRDVERAASWRADFYPGDAGAPRRVRVASVDGSGETGRAYDLFLSLTQAQIDPMIEPADLLVPVPPSARPTTLARVRQMGVLALNRDF